jgi:signal transduction histidine kinase
MRNIPPVLSSSRPFPGFAWLLGLAYVVLFVALDWASYIRPFQGLNITPWNPQAALAIALLLWRAQWVWVVWASLMAAEMVVRGIPAHWGAHLMATGALSLVYAAMARGLNGVLGRPPALATRRKLLWFTVILVAGALLNGVVYISAMSVAGLGPTGPIYEAVMRYWIGDAVGLVVVLPMLLVVMDPLRRAALFDSFRSPRWWIATALLCALLWFGFGWSGQEHYRYFYLLFLPVVWMSARLGVVGAVLASGLTQLGLIVAVQSLPHQDLMVFELQVLMAAITMTGLLLGVTVDERARAAVELHSSLRLAAAGQMTASLAHELSQPLTALSNYAHACRMLATESRDLRPQERERLIEVTQRMVEDAARAGAVVKRLRDFFRTGSTQLKCISPDAVLREAVAAHLRRAEVLHIRIESRLQDDLPPVWIDPVQIAVVLRNLIANAIDSASSAGGGGDVLVGASVVNGEWQVRVQDSGPGVDAARLQTLFEPGTSDKPGGMGIGLSICRAIIEAHGGRLWAEAGGGGHFCFALPVGKEEHFGVQNA